MLLFYINFFNFSNISIIGEFLISNNNFLFKCLEKKSIEVVSNFNPTGTLTASSPSPIIKA